MLSSLGHKSWHLDRTIRNCLPACLEIIYLFFTYIFSFSPFSLFALPDLLITSLFLSSFAAPVYENTELEPYNGKKNRGQERERKTTPTLIITECLQILLTQPPKNSNPQIAMYLTRGGDLHKKIIHLSHDKIAIIILCTGTPQTIG